MSSHLLPVNLDVSGSVDAHARDLGGLVAGGYAVIRVPGSWTLLTRPSVACSMADLALELLRVLLATGSVALNREPASTTTLSPVDLGDELLPADDGLRGGHRAE